VPRQPGWSTTREDLDSRARRRDLRVRIKERHKLLGPGIEITGVRISTRIEIDATDVVCVREHEPDAAATRRSKRLFKGEPGLGIVDPLLR
jgi:hypothetical protein